MDVADCDGSHNLPHRLIMSFADRIRHTSQSEEQGDYCNADQASNEVAAQLTEPTTLSHSVDLRLAMWTGFNVIGDLVRTSLVSSVPNVLQLRRDWTPEKAFGFVRHCYAL
ncbi:MAG: hypothetical protein M3R04_06455 [bacterium]|nr:hypothetical protein [bacterium]